MIKIPHCNWSNECFGSFTCWYVGQMIPPQLGHSPSERWLSGKRSLLLSGSLTFLLHNSKNSWGHQHITNKQHESSMSASFFLWKELPAGCAFRVVPLWVPLFLMDNTTEAWQCLVWMFSKISPPFLWQKSLSLLHSCTAYWKGLLKIIPG